MENEVEGEKNEQNGRKMQRKWNDRRFNRKTNYVLHQLTNIPVLICLFQMHVAVANSVLSVCLCVA